MTKRLCVAAILVALGWETSRGENLNLQPDAAQNASTNAFDSRLSMSSPPPQIWANGVGEGFRRGAREFDVTAGFGLGIRDGSVHTHNVVLTTVQFGQVLTDLWGQGHWYQGNVEMLGEAFVGAQFHPETRYLVGVAPVLRYNFATGTRWVPFVDASIGATATAIGRPDLGAVFEFDLQGGPGVQYFFRPNAALIFQDRYLHFSNASLYRVNKGINANTFIVGMGWFF